MRLDARTLAVATAEIVKGHVAAATAPLLRRIEELERRQPEVGPIGPRGERGIGVAGAVIDRDGDLIMMLSDGTTCKLGQFAIANACKVEAGEKGDPGPKGEKGETGIGLAGAVIDRKGALILTLSDGSTHDMGHVVGRDGKDGDRGEKGEPGLQGEPGIQGPPGERGERGEPGITGDKGQDGKDGRDGLNGRDGVDGFGFDDLCVEMVGQREFRVVFARDDRRKEFAFQLPVMIYRGVYRDGEEYAPGDITTWGGALWHCNEATKAKPGDGPWTLAVKKGRDGKDAKSS